MKLVLLGKNETEAWSAEYKGHTIQLVNQMKTKLLIDGQEVDCDKNLITSLGIFKGQIPESDEVVYVIVKSGMTSVRVIMLVGTELEVAHGVLHKDDGSFNVLEEDGEE